MSTDDPVAPHADAAANRLVGWKEISAHLRRSIRTVQRWERESNLPVRRYPTKRGEGVFAWPEELDGWLKSASGEVASELRGNGNGNGNHDSGAHEPAAIPDGTQNGAAAIGAPALPSQSSDPASALELGAPAPALAHVATPRLWWSALRRPLSLGILSIVVVTLCVHVWYVQTRATPRAQPATARIVGNDIVAFDAVGKLLWRYGLEARTKPGVEEPVLIEDLDGDGHREVVASLGGEPLQLNQVLCLDANGTKRWSRRPDRLVHYGHGPMGAPWVPILVKVTGPPERRSLWASWANSPFFGAFVERLDARTGAPTAVYWSAGYVTALEVGEVGGRPVLLLGGPNNEHLAASLAVYDLAVNEGSAPATNPKYACQDCPATRPLAFFVFPKTRLSRAAIAETAPLAVSGISVTQTGFIVAVAHNPPGGNIPGGNPADVLYRFDRNLRVVGGESIDAYRALHRDLERAGKLAAPHSAAEERELFPVLSWDGTKFVEITP